MIHTRPNFSKNFSKLHLLIISWEIPSHRKWEVLLIVQSWVSGKLWANDDFFNDMDHIDFEWHSLYVWELHICSSLIVWLAIRNG